MALFGHRRRPAVHRDHPAVAAGDRQDLGAGGSAPPPGPGRRDKTRHPVTPAWPSCRRACGSALTTARIPRRWDARTSSVPQPPRLPESPGRSASSPGAGLPRGPQAADRAAQLGATGPGRPAAGLQRPVRPPPPATSRTCPGTANPAGTCRRRSCGRSAPARTLAAPHIRTAIEILIDTGRRPEDIVALPLDCLARDAGGAAVLVYDNHKAHRLGAAAAVSQPQLN